MSGASAEADNDIRPVVRTGGAGNVGAIAFGAVLLAGGIGLFSALSANREAASFPSVAARGSEPAISSPPPLRLPPGFSPRLPVQTAPGGKPLPPVVLQRTAPISTPAPSSIASTSVQPRPSEPIEPQPPGPRVVYEQFRPELAPQPSGESGQLARDQDRVEARRLANPMMTVPQGTVIPAVLETAFDSTRPGNARALVQRDIFGFDGTRVLVPRGSRLFGTYAAGLNQGERRAAIQWTRLVRPDGVTIALDSPASDPLGRAGITGDVDSRFFARFGGALLQSVLDLGTGLATREVGNGVVLALPGSTQNIAASQGQQVQPVLRVEHGTTVSVFVARDLDFSSVER